MIRHYHVFPGQSEHVRRARHFVADVMDGIPVATDAELLVSEVATNAILHSRSGEPGGTFSLTVELAERTVRIEIRDQGRPILAPTTPHPPRGVRGLPERRRSSPYEDNGRGLFIVETLASRWGTSRDAQLHLVWFELDWKEPVE